MEPQQAKEVLELLKSEGVIDDDTIIGVLRRRPTATMKRMTTQMHNLLCKENHDTEECLWYTDDQLDTAWREHSHIAWIEKTQEYMEKMGITTEKELLRAISVVNSSMTALDSVPGAIELLLLTL